MGSGIKLVFPVGTSKASSFGGLSRHKKTLSTALASSRFLFHDNFFRTLTATSPTSSGRTRPVPGPQTSSLPRSTRGTSQVPGPATWTRPLSAPGTTSTRPARVRGAVAAAAAGELRRRISLQPNHHRRRHGHSPRAARRRRDWSVRCR